jgi:hypothetical protein
MYFRTRTCGMLPCTFRAAQSERYSNPSGLVLSLLIVGRMIVEEDSLRIKPEQTALLVGTMECAAKVRRPFVAFRLLVGWLPYFAATLVLLFSLQVSCGIMIYSPRLDGSGENWPHPKTALPFTPHPKLAVCKLHGIIENDDAWKHLKNSMFIVVGSKCLFLKT